MPESRVHRPSALNATLWLATGAAAGVVVGVLLAKRLGERRTLAGRLRGQMRGIWSGFERWVAEAQAEAGDEPDDELDDHADPAYDEAGDDSESEDAPPIDERVLAAFEQDPILSERAIEIDEPEPATIVLTGRVATADDAAHAVTIARGTPGVERVVDRLRVRAHSR